MLPVEIVDTILSHLDDVKTLLLVNRWWNQHARRHVWRRVTLCMRTEQRLLDHFAQACPPSLTLPPSATTIKHVTLIVSGKQEESRLDPLMQLIGYLHVQHLVLLMTSKWEQSIVRLILSFKGIRYLTCESVADIPITYAVLHSVKGWKLRELKLVLLDPLQVGLDIMWMDHPELEVLDVAYIPWKGPLVWDWIAAARMTRLRTLGISVECPFSLDAFQHGLSKCTRLDTLRLINTANANLGVDMGELLRVLQDTQLQNVSLCGNVFKTPQTPQTPSSLCMRTMRSLHISQPLSTPAFFRALASCTWPALTTLSMTMVTWNSHDMSTLLELAPCLQRIAVTQPSTHNLSMNYTTRSVSVHGTTDTVHSITRAHLQTHLLSLESLAQVRP
jgi:hypothetical protein